MTTIQDTNNNHNDQHHDDHHEDDHHHEDHDHHDHEDHHHDEQYFEPPPDPHTIDDLFVVLKSIEDLETDPGDRDNISFGDPKGDDLLAEAKYIAEELLVTEDGNCNWDNINLLGCASYKVVAIEEDENGWLLGGIQTKKGIIVYG